jgi:hypothetical protein
MFLFLLLFIFSPCVPCALLVFFVLILDAFCALGAPIFLLLLLLFSFLVFLLLVILKFLVLFVFTPSALVVLCFHSWCSCCSHSYYFSLSGVLV